MKLNEYGSFRGERRVAGITEESVYCALGLPWIPPELREDRGEIDLWSSSSTAVGPRGFAALLGLRRFGPAPAVDIVEREKEKKITVKATRPFRGVAPRSRDWTSRRAPCTISTWAGSWRQARSSGFLPK